MSFEIINTKTFTPLMYKSQLLEKEIRNSEDEPEGCLSNINLEK